MNAMPSPPACPDEAARLLPWFVNGTLSAPDSQFVQSHLEHCDTCRSDAAALTRMRGLLRSPGQVEHAPHNGLRKLMQRIDAAESLPQAAERSTASAGPTPAGRPARNRTAGWLAGAVVLQSLALVFVAAGILREPGTTDGAAYRTLTTVQAPAAQPVLRVLFAPSTTLAELQALLRDHGLAAQSGPSEAGLFTLSLRTPASDPAAGQAAALARLRTDPRVHFAETLGAGSARP